MISFGILTLDQQQPVGYHLSMSNLKSEKNLKDLEKILELTEPSPPHSTKWWAWKLLTDEARSLLRDLTSTTA